jgi:hypothetical protein
MQIKQKDSKLQLIQAKIDDTDQYIQKLKDQQDKHDKKYKILSSVKMDDRMKSKKGKN